MTTKREWRDRPCGIPAWVCTAGDFAGVVADLVSRGELVLALDMLKAAESANVIGRIEAAAQEAVAEKGDGT